MQQEHHPLEILCAWQDPEYMHRQASKPIKLQALPLTPSVSRLLPRQALRGDAPHIGTHRLGTRVLMFLLAFSKPPKHRSPCCRHSDDPPNSLNQLLWRFHSARGRYRCLSRMGKTTERRPTGGVVYSRRSRVAFRIFRSETINGLTDIEQGSEVLKGPK